MNHQDVAYVELTLPQSAKDYLNDITTQIVKDAQYYTSTVVPRINGNVTSKAHLTLFFGLDPSMVENADLISLLNENKVSELKLGEFILMNGYQGLYKILCITVSDEDKTLSKFVNKIRKFSDRPNSYEFKPHITLAYVQPDYELPSKMPSLNSTLEVKESKISI